MNLHPEMTKEELLEAAESDKFFGHIDLIYQNGKPIMADVIRKVKIVPEKESDDGVV